METLTVYYSVQSGGDGSAYPQFFETMELADLDQDNPYGGEGWGESCTGSLTLESESPITAHGITTAVQMLAEVEEELEYDKDDSRLNKMRDSLIAIINR